jgi:hypothetical protein
MLDYMQADPEVTGDGYTLEVLDNHGNTVALEYDLGDFTKAYQYAIYNSSFDTTDYVVLRGGDMPNPLLFEDGVLVSE